MFFHYPVGRTKLNITQYVTKKANKFNFSAVENPVVITFSCYRSIQSLNNMSLENSSVEIQIWKLVYMSLKTIGPLTWIPSAFCDFIKGHPKSQLIRVLKIISTKIDISMLILLIDNIWLKFGRRWPYQKNLLKKRKTIWLLCFLSGCVHGLEHLSYLSWSLKHTMLKKNMISHIRLHTMFI